MMFVVPEATAPEQRAAAGSAPFNAKEVVERVKAQGAEDTAITASVAPAAAPVAAIWLDDRCAVRLWAALPSLPRCCFQCSPSCTCAVPGHGGDDDLAREHRCDTGSGRCRPECRSGPRR